MSDDVNSQPPTGAPEPPNRQGNGDAAPTPWTPSGNQPGMPQPPAPWSQSGPGQDSSYSPPPMTPPSSWETPSGPVPQDGPKEVIHHAPSTDPYAPPSAGAPDLYSSQGAYPGAAPGGYAPQGGAGVPGSNGPEVPGVAANYGAPDPFGAPQGGPAAPQGSPYPGMAAPASPQGPGVNPYGGGAGYTPPGTPMGAAAKRNNTPIFIALAVGVIAIISVIALVVTFMLQSAGGAPGDTAGGATDPSGPKETSGVPDPEDQASGEDPDAATGGKDQSGSAAQGQSGGDAATVPTGGYEPPASAWLHEGYGTGVDTWETNGELIGTSKDNSIVVFQQTGDSGRGIVGFDAKTGTEKWRNDFESGSYISCNDVRAGIAYCSERANQENTLITMDLSTGKTTAQLKLTDDQILSAAFGAQLGRTYWVLENTEAETSTLVAVKDGAIAWEAPLEKSSLCILGDQAIGCSSRREGSDYRVQTFDANNGSAMLDMEGKIIPQWHRDGVVIMNSEDKTNVHYSWKGEKVADVDFQIGDPRPKSTNGVLNPVATRDKKNVVEMVDPDGKPVITSTFTKSGEAGTRVFVHSGTGKEIGTPAPSQTVVGSASGKTIAVDYFDEGKLIFYRDDGSEVAQFTYGKDGHVNVDHGILISTSSDGKKTTVYAPQG